MTPILSSTILGAQSDARLLALAARGERGDRLTRPSRSLPVSGGQWRAGRSAA
jgi:hypothetical protein